ncbi:MAG: LPS export ABC transporter periplasmic protein LptC, partial [Bacteroidota bacterium]|nr:LPS export ABC transporter periplasmic protein LptC [Bacteroidota bacterium]
EDVNKKIYFTQGILVHFYNKQGKEESYMSSKYAIYHEEDNLWEASDSVVVVNSEGEILNTELLFWDEKTEKIYSSKFVKITTMNDVIHGEGFEADQTFSTWNIKKMTGTIYHTN